MILTVSIYCRCLDILLFLKFPLTNNKVQYLLGEHETTNPFYEHISSFDQIEILSSSSNGMTQLHYWFLDLHEETLGKLLSTSLYAKNQILVLLYNLYEMKKKKNTTKCLFPYEYYHQQSNSCGNSLRTYAHLQIC